MKRIKVLADNVKQKIAAGEVIEGPFSVIKELLENAIDAGSDEIVVQVEDSGLKKILVQDNGSGIHADDVRLAITEHATSKINDVYDIETISSYGFRGEALSSISSVSSLTILTRQKDADLGTKLVKNNEQVTVADYAGPQGTTIIVENLFYNVPARKKFLKAKKTETKNIREIFIKTALVNHQVTFYLEIDNKRSYTLQKTATIAERVKQVYGQDTFDSLYYVELNDLKVSISGFLSKPHFLKSTRSMQHLYVNNRPVEYKYLGFTLSRAYEAVAMRGKHPAAVIFITIDPKLIDVNIHPAKREVKLFDQRYIDSLVFHLAEKALNREHQVNAVFKTTEQDVTAGRKTAGTFPVDTESQKADRKTEDSSAGEPQPAEIQQRIQFPRNAEPAADDRQTTGSFIREVAGIYKESRNNHDTRIFGVTLNTYVLAEKQDNLYFIDFHAAHERFIYDSLSEKNYSFDKQNLVLPRMLKLSLEDYSLVVDNIEKFNEIGFDMDEFSDNTIIVRSVPSILERFEGEAAIEEFIESIKAEKEDDFDIKDNIIKTLACHSARRRGDRLSSEEMERLVDEALSGIHDMRCPHGRPYVFKMQKNDLERMFKRL